MTAFHLTKSQAAELHKIVSLYRPQRVPSWRKRDSDWLWLRVLSQIVVAGNAAPGETLLSSQSVKERLSFARLRRMKPKSRRRLIHRIFLAIGTRYVGQNANNRKLDAALHNFQVLVNAGGPKHFFENISKMKRTDEKITFLSKTSGLKFYKKKGTRDTLIGLRLDGNCLALDQRLVRILREVGARIDGSIDRQYEQIERELIEKVAEPCGLSGAELDNVLFCNYGDIKVRLLCP
jgi:hypothetical protein